MGFLGHDLREQLSLGVEAPRPGKPGRGFLLSAISRMITSSQRRNVALPPFSQSRGTGERCSPSHVCQAA
jgi:hypothetical protein